MAVWKLVREVHSVHSSSIVSPARRSCPFIKELVRTSENTVGTNMSHGVCISPESAGMKEVIDTYRNVGHGQWKRTNSVKLGTSVVSLGTKLTGRFNSSFKLAGSRKALDSKLTGRILDPNSKERKTVDVPNSKGRKQLIFQTP